MPGKNLTRAEAEARAALISVDSYDIDLNLLGDGDTFLSTTTVRFSCRQGGATSFIDLIAPHVRRVVLNGIDLDADQVFADSRITLDGLATENSLTVVADAAWSHTGEGLHRFTDPVDQQTYCYTQFEVADARRVFASFEQPDLKARLTFHVTAPANWTVWSNQPVTVVEPASPATLAAAGVTGTGAGAWGTADAADPDLAGARTWHFMTSDVMSTYLAAIVAGPYSHWESSYTSVTGRQIPLSLLVRPSMAQYLDTDEIFDITRRGFEFYEQAFGVPYPYQKYDQAFVPEYNAGAMENIGLVTITEVYVFRSKPTQARVDRRAITILHEQAHMWFGDLVTMRWWNDLWLNESFAEFVSHLAAAGTRWPHAWTDFQAAEKSWAFNQDQLPSTHPIVATIRDLADVEVNFDGITYAKGASVLRQLVAWVGQAHFLAGVSAYLKRYAWGNATLADLLAELELASGRDLAEWSQVWLEEAGVTQLAPRWGEPEEPPSPAAEPPSPAVEPGRSLPPATATGGITLELVQSVPPIYAEQARDLGGEPVCPTLRPHRLAVSGYDLAPAGDLAISWSVETDITGEVSRLTVPGRPDLLVINDSDLAYAKTRLDDRSLATAVAHLGGIGDSLARAIVWGALWDATRDGELPASFFVQAVINNIAAETASTVIQTLLSQLSTSLRYFVVPERRQELSGQAATALIGLTLAAEAGSDAQLQFFKAFTALAGEPAVLDQLAEIYSGELVIPGLVLDTDLNWEVLSALVARGRLGSAAIEARLTADPTTKGRESAAGARAADPSAKQAAWELATADETITNATQRAVIGGFSQVSDPAQLAGFVPAYFAVLESVWANRSREMATNIVQGLYPAQCLNNTDVIQATDDWLANLGDRTPALRRLVVERRAFVVRALRAQQADAAA